jgi:signal transduction histidine kinase
MAPRLRLVAQNLGLAAVYFIAARFGLAFNPVSGFATVIWPPTGIAFAAILLLGNRVAPGIFVGALVANLFAGAPLAVAAAIGVGNASEALVGGALLRRVRNFSITLENVPSALALIVRAAMLSTLISATIGIASLYAGGIVQSSQIGDAWRAWWVGDMVGCLLITPVILVWRTTPRAKREVHWLETAGLVVALVVVSALTFLGNVKLATPFHQADLLGAVLLWSAIRFGARGATTAVLCVSVAAIVATALRFGPFAMPALSDRLLLLQTFMGIIAATCLLFSATVAERRIANQEVRRAQVAAELANSAKSQFLRVMSHELRTPLNAIQGFAELMETGVYGPLNEKQTDALKRIEKNEQDLLSLINEMLGFVDAENAPAEVEYTDVQVAEVIEAAQRVIAHDVARKHLVLKRELSDPYIAVRADAKGLEQVLASLLSNAAKYSNDGGTITLGATVDAVGKKVRVWVRDTGAGIRKDELARVFEPFFQAEGGTTRRYSGIGLGLTIARNLAQRMNGEVTIESEAGVGTMASVVLPATSPHARSEVTVSVVRDAA